MKTKTLVLCMLCALSSLVYSQSQSMIYTEWVTNTGTQIFFYKTTTKTDAAGNVYLVGATTTSLGTTDILVSKKNAAGVTIWTKQVNGVANANDYALGMAVSSTGDVYVTGVITNNTTTFLPDVVIIKYNSAGTLQWMQTYNGVADLADFGRDVKIDGSNNIFVTGASYNTSGNTDFLTLKYTPSGVLQWANVYAYSAGLNDAGVKIAFSGSNVLVSGAVTQSANNYKYNTITLAGSTGVLSNVNTSTAVTTSSVDVVSDFITDGAGNSFLVGSVNVAGQGTNYYVVKLNNTLGIIWSATYNGASNLDDVAKGVKVDASGNVYVTGYSTSATQGRNIVTIKYNSSGAQQWVQTHNSPSNGNDEASDMEIDANANIYICGSVPSAVNQLDYYTVKYNSAGTKIWEIQTDVKHLNDQATNVALDSLDNVIVTGQSETSAGVYEYTTFKYVQHTTYAYNDINSEAGDPNFQFMPNKGQLYTSAGNNSSDILYYNISNTPQTYIAKNRISFLQTHQDTVVSTIDSTERMDLVFVKPNAGSKLYTEDEGSPNVFNYFIGNTIATDVHSYKKLIAFDVYPGIDVHYYSNNQGLKCYFVVKPTANPNLIKFILQGQQSATVTAGNLKINGKLGSIMLRKPNVYNVNGVSNTSITATWAVASNSVSLTLGAYNAAQNLVIEFSNINPFYIAPSPLSGPADNLYWCTYIGDSEVDELRRVATDKNNNKYVAGGSQFNSYPIVAGSYQTINNSANAYIGVVSRFNNINQLKASTYYSGTATQNPFLAPTVNINALAIDSNQNVFFAGTTNNSNFPHLTNQLSPIFNYTNNPANATASYNTGFIVKMDSLLKIRLWTTHIGNASTTFINDITIDNNQNLVTVGYNDSYNSSLNFPTPPVGAYYNLAPRGFLFRFSNTGVPKYGTRLAENLKSIAYNKLNGDYAVGGYNVTATLSQKYKNPGGGAYFDNTVNGGSDMYLARFNNQDSITWATLVGGSNSEIFQDLDLRDSTLVLVGGSSGAGFPIKYQTGQFVDSTHSGGSQTDIAFIRFNSYTGQHRYSSYYGDNLSSEIANTCLIDNFGNYFIGGATKTNPANFNLQTLSSFYFSNANDLPDGFLLSYSPNNNKRLTTYFGGRTYNASSGFFKPNDENIYDMALTSVGDLYMVGNTVSNFNFPIYDASAGVAYFDNVQNGFVSGSCCGPTDGFIAAFNNLQTVGINELDKNNTYGSIAVYPNPSNGIFNVVIEGLESNKLITFNV